MKLLIESQFLPPISSFAFFAKADEIIIEAHENYQKRSYRNRALILNPNGVFSISVPLLKGKNQKKPIQEVKVSYETDWISQVKKQLQSAYGKSPFFIHYQDAFLKVFDEKTDTLFELNHALTSHIFTLLGWSKKISFSKEFLERVDPDICDLRNVLSPIERHDDKSIVRISYSQVFEYKFGHTEGLSILDLLFNAGPESVSLLKNAKLPLICKTLATK